MMSDKKQEKRERIQQLDVIRTIACMAIVLLHTVSTWMADSVGSESYYSYLWKYAAFYHVGTALLVRWAVPAFFMMSGILFTRYELNIKKHISRILLIIATFGTTYSFIEVAVIEKKIGIVEICKAVFNMLQDKSWAHMWFLYAIVGCYIISPLIRAFVKNSDISGQIKLLVIGVMLLSVIPSINALTGLTFTTFGIQDYAGAFLYFYTGAVINTFIDCGLLKADEKRDKLSRYAIFTTIGGGIALCVMEVIGFYQKHMWANPSMIWTYAYSMGVFYMLLIKIHPLKVLRVKWVKDVADNSLWIYVVHMLFLNALYKGVKVFPNKINPVIGVFAIFIMVLFFSLLSVIVANKIIRIIMKDKMRCVE